MQEINLQIDCNYMGYKNLSFLLKNKYQRSIKLDNEDLIQERFGIFSIISLESTEFDTCIIGIELNHIYQGKSIEYIKIGDQIINNIKVIQ